MDSKRSSSERSSGEAWAADVDARLKAHNQNARVPTENERPCYRVYDARIDHQGKKLQPGVYFHGLKETKQGVQVFDLWICGPLHVDADLCALGGTDFGLMLRFMNRRGDWRQWAMPMELLKGSGEELGGQLLSLG